MDFPLRGPENNLVHIGNLIAAGTTPSSFHETGSIIAM
jgi:hypothetical protein